MKNLISRRSLILSLLTIPLAFTSALFASAKPGAQKKTITTTEADAKKGLVSPADPVPSAFKYVEKASSAPTRTNSNAQCANCMHYTQAVAADKKEIKLQSVAVGTCMLFNAGKGFVKSGGWCMSWMQAPT